MCIRCSTILTVQTNIYFLSKLSKVYYFVIKIKEVFTMSAIQLEP